MAKPKSDSTHLLIGRFRITSKYQRGQDFVDEEVEGYFEFKKDADVTSTSATDTAGNFGRVTESSSHTLPLHVHKE